MSDCQNLRSIRLTDPVLTKILFTAWHSSCRRFGITWYERAGDRDRHETCPDHDVNRFSPADTRR